MNKKLLIIPAVLIGLALTTAGSCDGATHQDAPDPQGNAQLTKMQVITMPNGFRNFVVGCLPGTKTMVLVTSRGVINGNGDSSGSTNIASSITSAENAQYCGGTAPNAAATPAN